MSLAKEFSKVSTHPHALEAYENFPPNIREKLFVLREWILEEAEKLESVKRVEESLKWGEPSFRSNIGSTLRLNWTEKRPEIIGFYCQCTSLLVPSFKNVFKDRFIYDGSRGILLYEDQAFPEYELRKCFSAGLQYHKVKNLNNLGLE